MDGLGAEVSAKIRSAIKAKLIELEAYVDDELPDYIMVMVANNRTKTQMEEDLGLFLNNNTTAFTNWLHAVLEKLKKVTLEEVTKKEVKKKKVKKVSEKPVKKVKDGKEKSGKDSGRLEREDRRRREGKEKAERSSRARSKERKSSSSRPSKPPPKGVPVSKDNANLAELGPMKRKKKSSTSGGLDGSGGTENYNPASLLKSALGKTKENKGSPKKSSKKRSSSSSRREPSKREKEDREQEREERKEVEDRRSRSRAKDEGEKSSSKERPKTIINLKEEANFYARDSRGRDRSRSGSPRRTKVASLVSKVVRPPSQVSRSGRSERRRSRSFSPGAAYDIGYDPERESRRLASRAQLPPRPQRAMGREGVGAARVMGKAMMDSVTMSERRMGREEAREREERGRRAGPRLSPEDTRFEELRRRHEEMERRAALEERREGRDSRATRGRLAMDRESVRVERRDGIKEEIVREEPEEMRIIVRRELTPETVTPPKKVKLEEEDAELLEMRRKALESLMKRTDRELVGRRSSPRLMDESSESSSSESEDSTEESEEESNLKEEGEGGKPEPTFVVTLDGLDKKYFKSQGKGALELAREKMEPTALKAEPRVKSKPSEKTSRVDKVKKESAGSKMSSDGELELHPHEEFDEAPNAKKVVHKVTTAGQESARPTMKVAARKRSPILAAANGTKKVAEVKPVVSTAAPAKQLAGSYAARLTAIKAAKAAEAASKQTAAPAAKKSTVETEPAPSAKSNLVTKSDTAPKTNAPVRAKITGPSPMAPKPVPKQLSAPAKAPVVSKDSPTVTKVKRTFTPIGAPSPDPIPSVSRFKSAPPAYLPPSKVVSSSETICRFWPQCKWKDACAFKHPPVKGSPESVLATSSNVNKFKWSAK